MRTKEEVVRTLKLKELVKISGVEGYECLSRKYVNVLKTECELCSLGFNSYDRHSRKKKRKRK